VRRPECLGDAKWFAEATADIAMQLAEQVPGLDSPLLRLVKERNEARELVKRMLKATEGMTSRRGILLGDAGGTPRGDDLERRCQVSDDYERDDRCNDEQREANIANARISRAHSTAWRPMECRLILMMMADEEDA
jgi:hypothetical protein